MQVKIQGRQIELTEALKNHVNKKLEKLKKYTDNILNASVVLSVQKYRQFAEITVHVDDQIMIGKSETNDMYVSIDQCVEKIETQLKKRKARYHSSKKKETSEKKSSESIVEKS
ncbi:MAG: ribosome-associated translation inhibitor RaiA [Candidatus Schekmanbacteria bacterium]|nr:MAG: ribosome-associated translation inhibitor RaiA [Candidatus Schekmanbacteria bacterium]